MNTQYFGTETYGHTEIFSPTIHLIESLHILSIKVEEPSFMVWLNHN